jgi:hypothetical protein
MHACYSDSRPTLAPDTPHALCRHQPPWQEFEEFRRSLIRYETEMLKAFGFITNVEHPHQVRAARRQLRSLLPAPSCGLCVVPGSGNMHTHALTHTTCSLQAHAR